MPRKSAVTSTPRAATGQKRKVVTPLSVTPTTPGTRTSARLRDATEHDPPGKVTPKKSKYFDGPDSDEDDPVEAMESPVASGYEDEDASATEPSESPSETDGYDSEDDKRPKKKAKKSLSSRVSQTGDQTNEKRTDLWKEGVKTGLGPGKQVFIAKPKPRSDGGIKYVPHKIHPNTMAFLTDLRKNNDREWLKMHDADYRQSWKDWESMVETLTEKIAEVDETIPELPPKDLVFRIYRDVRFSKDPTPYKPHFSAAWSRTGRKGPYAHYYLQIQPGGRSFIGSGMWHPEAQPLDLLRQDIYRRPERIKAVLVSPGIRKHIFGGIGGDEQKAVKAFVTQTSNAENALKKYPMGYLPKPNSMELMRLKNFTLGKRIEDEEILKPDFVDQMKKMVQIMHPFVTYLNSVVMPDDNGDDDGDDDDNDDAASGDDDDGSE